MDPRGIRNNNPGNIRAGVGYEGEVGADDKGFATFDTPDHGLRAMSSLLDAYSQNHGLNTVTGILNRYAPPAENDTGAYVQAVSQAVGAGPDQVLDMSDPAVKDKLIHAIVLHENGYDPYSAQSRLVRGNMAPTTVAPTTGDGQIDPNLNNFTTQPAQGVDPTSWVNPSELLSRPEQAPTINPLAPEQREQNHITDQPGNAGVNQDNNNFFGTSQYPRALQQEAGLNQSWWEPGYKELRSQNFVSGAFQWAYRQMAPSDPNFSWEGNREEFQSSVPMEYWSSYNSVNSRGEMEALQAQIHQEMGDRQMINDAGLTGQLGATAAGMFDIDTALTLMTGGGYEVAKAASMGARLSKLGRGAMQGGAFAGVAAYGNAFVRPTGNFHEAMSGVIAGAALGALAGPAGHEERLFNASNADVLGGYQEFRSMGEDAMDSRGWSPYSADAPTRQTAKDDLMGGSAMDDRGSMGAAVNNDPNRPIKSSDTVFTAGANGQPIPNSFRSKWNEAGLSDDVISVIDTAQIWRDASDWNNRIENAYKDAPRTKRFVDAVNKIPGFQSDWETMANSPSAIMNKMSFDLLESPTGIVRKNRSAAMLQDNYQQTMAAKFKPVEDAYQAWGQSQQLSWMDRNWNDAARRQFGKDLWQELMRRRMNSPFPPGGINKHVVQAADAWQEGMDLAKKYNEGQFGEHAVKGFDNIQWKPGYFPLIWQGDQIDSAIGRIGKPAMIEDMGFQYRKLNPGLTKDESEQIADAVIGVARVKDSEVDMNLMGLLAGDGRAYLLRELEKKVGPQQAQLIVNRLGGTLEERGTTGRAKGRTEIDLRATLRDGTPLLDLVNTDAQHVMQAYTRQTAGQAALARAGYTSKADVTKAIDYALQEQKALGVDKTDKRYVSREHLEGIFSYFGGGTVGQGVSQVVRMMKGVTNLSVLNQLGLQQAVESSALLAAVGWKKWVELAPTAIREAFTGAPNGTRMSLAKEMEPLMGNIGDIHNVYRPDIMFDEIQKNPSFAGQWMDTLEKAINRGQRIQGFTTGFYQIQAAQHRMTVELMTQKVMAAMKGGVLSKEMEQRLATLGIEGRFLQRLKAMTDQHVTWKPDGTVDMLNIAKWDFRTQQDFALSMNRAVGMLVQRTMHGEGSFWMSQNWGSLMMHLKTFPFISIKKQFASNTRIGDVESKALFLYGIGLGSAMYALKQALSGNTDNLDPVQVAKGGFGMANMTGWVPMFTDPVATMMGMDSIRLGASSARGVDTGIVATPPVFGTLNKIGHLPGAMAHIFSGNGSTTDYAALKALPLVGNYYGSARAIAAMQGPTKALTPNQVARKSISNLQADTIVTKTQIRQAKARDANAQAHAKLDAVTTKGLKQLDEQVPQ